MTNDRPDAFAHVEVLDPKTHWTVTPDGHHELWYRIDDDLCGARKIGSYYQRGRLFYGLRDNLKGAPEVRQARRAATVRAWIEEVLAELVAR